MVAKSRVLLGWANKNGANHNYSTGDTSILVDNELIISQIYPDTPLIIQINNKTTMFYLFLVIIVFLFSLFVFLIGKVTQKNNYNQKQIKHCGFILHSLRKKVPLHKIKKKKKCKRQDKTA